MTESASTERVSSGSRGPGTSKQSALIADLVDRCILTALMRSEITNYQRSKETRTTTFSSKSQSPDYFNVPTVNS